MDGKSVLYKGQVLTLTKYFGGPCLSINGSSQRSIPKMQFVSGYPNEYCIYIKNLTKKTDNRFRWKANRYRGGISKNLFIKGYRKKTGYTGLSHGEPGAVLRKKQMDNKRF